MSNLYSNSMVKYAVAGAGLCFLGYCIYFDNKRRNHPDFKKKLKERKSHCLNLLSYAMPTTILQKR